MTLLDTFPHRVTITARAPYTRDSLGGVSQGDGTVRSTGVVAWVQPATQGDIDAFKRRDAVVSHKIFFVADPELTEGDDITVESGPSFVGEKLRYVSDDEAGAGTGIVFKAMATTILGGS